MAVAHSLCSGMGGIRTSGDLVSRMELARSMRIGEAKAYVAKKLGVDPFELSNEGLMRDMREELGIGVITAVPGLPKGIPAKMNIENLLGIKINSCEHFRSKLRN